MLESLHVKNLALIDEEDVCFGKGLNILTGETGAGKSVILGSVSLALGGKADKELIRTGADYALIELVFSLNKHQAERLKELDFFPEEDGSFVLQRKIMPSRSVCKACGETVGAKQLQGIAEILLDIHGQHEHQSLLNKRKHKEILDDYAGSIATKLKKGIQEKYQEYAGLLKELEKKGQDEAGRRKEAEFLRFEIDEITQAAIRPGEDEEMEQLYRKMLNGRRIKEAVAAMYRLTGWGSGESAGENVGRALKELRSVSSYDEALADLESQLLDVDGLLSDFNRAAAEYMEGLEFEEEDFLQTESRLNLLNHLKAKYGKSLEAVAAYRQQGEERLHILENFEVYRQEILHRAEELQKLLLIESERLSEKRKKAAAELGKKLKQALQDLNFEEIQFEICVTPQLQQLTEEGYDDVEFMISTNKGESLKPLSQVASGGELSRIMLAFKTVLADKDQIETLIFDEIDTGISGRTAWKVSEKMAILGKDRQVICITHLPQIAAMADTHFLIKKGTEGERTVTRIRSLEEEESLKELARMLGGDQITEAALQNAREMKELAENSKQYS